MPCRNLSTTTGCYSPGAVGRIDRKSTRLNSSHLVISYAVFCLKKKTDRLSLSYYLQAALSKRRPARSLSEHAFALPLFPLSTPYVFTFVARSDRMAFYRSDASS